MQEAFYTNSYPADKDANRFLVKFVKLFSLFIAGSDSYVIYSLACHLYTYVTTIHREPDTVLIACGVYVLGLTLRAVLAGLGYNFANTHTDRTPRELQESVQIPAHSPRVQWPDRIRRVQVLRVSH